MDLNASNVASKRLKTFSFSRWGASDTDFSGLKLTNAAGEESMLIGTERHAWESVTLQDQPIKKITMFEKNCNYMKGFRIQYRNGQTDIINADSGTEVGSIEFEPFDELIGMTVQSASDRKPRKFGFTIMRNG